MLISLDEIKLHLRLELGPDSEADPELEAMYSTALDYCENFLGRSIPWTSDNELNSSVRSAMLLIIGDLYENREARTGGEYSASSTVERLLHFHRVGLGI